jgi:hypothetical protein
MNDTHKDKIAPRRMEALKRIGELRGLAGEEFYWRFVFILLENGLMEPWQVVFRSSGSYDLSQGDCGYKIKGETCVSVVGEGDHPVQPFPLTPARSKVA